MGNCLGCNSLKRQRDIEDTVSYKITNWIDNSDFSSKPDLELVCSDPSLLDLVIKPVEIVANENLHDTEDGYLTAVEHIDESDDEHQLEPSLNTSYETSDEQVEQLSNVEVMPVSSEDVRNNNIAVSSSDDTSSVEAEERINTYNYELRPIRPMPTPIRENVLSPSIRLEQIVNDSGRVSHKRLMKYMQLRQKKPFPLSFPEVV